MEPSYDFLVIGGGPGGTPSAMALAKAGKTVLLVEKGQGLGGTCLFEGCIPSKILRESARRLREIREARDFGLCMASDDIRIDWYAIQERKRAILQKRSNGALKKVAQIPALELVNGTASLLDATHASVVTHAGEEKTVSFKQAIIATGSTPSRPPINGIEHHRVLDSEAILDIDHIPKRLVIIGAGPVGVELGQIFKTFGSNVTLLEAGSHILGPVDQELAERLKQQMILEGVTVTTQCRIDRISNTGDGIFVEYRNADDKSFHQFADTVLLVTGRHPNIAGLGLENTRIQHKPHGIIVNAQLQTEEPNIFAVGDVIGHPMFAHWATAQGLALARNLLGQEVPFPEENANSAVIFSDPEIGMAGLTEAQAEGAGIKFKVARYNFATDARAQITGRDSGLLKIIYEAKTHRVIGVHILVEGADDLMGEASLIVRTGLPLEAIVGSIHPHPTLTEAFVQAARSALTSGG
jgi:dihydrolipoamide dehydrogenase